MQGIGMKAGMTSRCAGRGMVSLRAAAAAASREAVWHRHRLPVRIEQYSYEAGVRLHQDTG